MKERISDILRGKFLVNGDAWRNWVLIFFISFLAIVMIASSHVADEKVHHIAKLNNEIKALRSQMLETREALMHLKMESAVIKHVSESGLVSSVVPPKKIIVN